MAVSKIPESHEYICDVCTTRRVLPGPSVFAPPSWSKLKWDRHLYNEGTLVRDNTDERLLCNECTPKATAALNRVFEDVAGSDRAEIR